MQFRLVFNQTGKETSFHDQPQRVVIEVLYSTGRLVMGEVLQWSVPGPLLFNIFINDLEEVTECLPTGFAADAKSGGIINTLKGRADIQGDLEAEGMIQEGQMQSPTPGKEEFLAIAQAESAWLAVICRKGPGGWWAGH